MTARKPPAEDSDIIEGTAVERQEDDTASGGTPAGGRSRRRTAKKADRGGKAGAAQDQTDAGPQAGAGPSTGAPAASSPKPMMLAGLALLLGLAGIGLQFWRSGTADNALRAEIDGLAAQLAAVEAEAAMARSEAADLRDVLAGLSDSLPPDLSADLAGLAERQDVLEAGLAAMETAGQAPLASGDDAALALAQSGMSVATAMINDSRSGLDPSRWLATLGELRAAGLTVGDLESLRAAMSPLPPTVERLMADARALIEPLRRETAAGGDDGWWSAATGRLSDFIRLRRQGDAAAQDGAARADTPLLAFERAVMADRLGDALAATADIAADLEADLGADIPALEAWRLAAGRRLALDDRLAGLSADMATQLARARTGKAE